MAHPGAHFGFECVGCGRWKSDGGSPTSRWCRSDQCQRMRRAGGRDEFFAKEIARQIRAAIGRREVGSPDWRKKYPARVVAWLDGFAETAPDGAIAAPTTRAVRWCNADGGCGSVSYFNADGAGDLRTRGANAGRWLVKSLAMEAKTRTKRPVKYSTNSKSKNYAPLARLKVGGLDGSIDPHDRNRKTRVVRIEHQTRAQRKAAGDKDPAWWQGPVKNRRHWGAYHRGAASFVENDSKPGYGQGGDPNRNTDGTRKKSPARKTTRRPGGGRRAPRRTSAP